MIALSEQGVAWASAMPTLTLFRRAALTGPADYQSPPPLEAVCVEVAWEAPLFLLQCLRWLSSPLRPLVGNGCPL